MQVVYPLFEDHVVECINPPDRFIGGVKEPEVEEVVLLVVAGRVLPVDGF